MKEVVNILYIEKITVDPRSQNSNECAMPSLKATLYASLRAYCPISGQLFRKKNLETWGESRDGNEAILFSIQNFFNGSIYVAGYDCYPVFSPGSIQTNKVIDIRYEISEPFRQMFKDLFNVNNWHFESNQLQLNGF